MQYPLLLKFKSIALAPQISITDANDNLLFYVKQKALKLKESVTVFSDKEMTKPLYTMNANQILDFSARYEFADAEGSTLGAVQRKGMKSIWSARYEIVDGNRHIMTIRESNPWIKVLDHIFGELPVIGMFSGYLFHPSFVLTPAESESKELMRLTKKPAFLEGKFTLEKQGQLNEHEETLALLSLLMMTLLERGRG